MSYDCRKFVVKWWQLLDLRHCKIIKIVVMSYINRAPDQAYCYGASKAENGMRLLGKCSQLPLSPYRYMRGTGQRSALLKIIPVVLL